MSGENVENFRRADAAFSRGDRDAWIECFDPDAEMVPAREWPENAAIRGPEAAWDSYVGRMEAWEVDSLAVGEVIEADPDKVIAHFRQQVKGRASGADVVFSYWLVSTYRNGKVIRSEWFADRAEALKAAGLSE
jgi:ketosteroid isomerase-like protein